MKKNILIPILVLITFSSCKTAFKTGQTPDDVYYSPASEARQDRRSTQNDYYTDDERYLRMKVRNNSRWRMIDDYTYWNTPYMYYGYNYNTWYNPNLYNTFWFNQFNSNWGFTHGYVYYPYNPVFIVKNQIKTANTNRTSFGGYKNNKYNNTNNGNSVKRTYTRSNNNSNYSGRTYTNSTPAGTYTPSNNNNNNSGRTYTNSTPDRTYTPSTPSAGSSGGSSGGGLSRPARRS